LTGSRPQMNSLGGDTMDPGSVDAFLKTIDCYVMGSRTYETAIGFEAKGLGRAYGDKPSFVLTSRELPRTRETVEFYPGDLAQFVNGHLRPKFRAIWFCWRQYCLRPMSSSRASRRNSLFDNPDLNWGRDPVLCEARQRHRPASSGSQGLHEWRG
jgi:hypothetical protein